MRSGGGTPGNSWWGCAALFSKSYPYLRPPKMLFSTPVFRPDLQSPYTFPDLALTQKLCNHFSLRLERKQKHKTFLQMHFKFAYFYFFLIHLELKGLIRSHTPVVPSKTIPDSRSKWAQCIPVSDQRRPKTIPFSLWLIYGSNPPTGHCLFFRKNTFLHLSIAKVTGQQRGRVHW